MSVVDSIKLGKVSVGEISCCGITGCLSCQGKQSTSSLSLSSSGRSLLILLDLFNFYNFQWQGSPWGTQLAIGLLQLGAAVGRDVMAVGMEYQGGAVEGLGNTMVIGVVKLMGVQEAI